MNLAIVSFHLPVEMFFWTENNKTWETSPKNLKIPIDDAIHGMHQWRGGWAICRSFNENKNIKHGKHLNTLQEYWWMMQYTGCRVGVESSIDSWILLLCFFTCPFFRRMRTRQQKKWDTSQPTPKRSVEKTMQCTGCKGGCWTSYRTLDDFDFFTRSACKMGFFDETSPWWKWGVVPPRALRRSVELYHLLSGWCKNTGR